VNILGLSFSVGCHDTSAALVCDGELVAATEEERFTRQKHESAFPNHAIAFCLRRAGIRMSDVDAIAYADLPFRSGRASHHGEMEYSFFEEMHADRRLRFRSLVHKRALDLFLNAGFSFNLCMNASASWALSQLCKAYGRVPPLRFYDHHRAHAAAAFFTSGLRRSAIATLDRRAALCSSVTWEATENRLRRIHSAPFYNSLGEFYSDCTSYLGFGDFAEGKTMGLASYGNREVYAEAISAILKTSGPEWYQYRMPPSPTSLGFNPRNEEFVVRTPYSDFAAAAQYALQQGIERVVGSAMSAAQCDDLCLGGGVALNCTSNGALLASRMPSSLWIFPATGDAGLAVGAALLCAREAGELKRKRIDHAYWGPEFGPSECERALRAVSRLVYRRISDVTKEVAGYLAAGEVVGWFQGAMELGPRALGNRSILADPRRKETRDRVNSIKGREMWRPLSPVVLAERASDFFNLAVPSPFMLFATMVRRENQALIPAVVHVDGSARPQTVTKNQNPRFYDLIMAFSERTGIPVLLNTSFNTAGEPIVCTPEDAIKTFLVTNLDVLVLGDYVARKQIGVEYTETTARAG
jgi:carbamoyltransferase